MDRYGRQKRMDGYGNQDDKQTRGSYRRLLDNVFDVNDAISVSYNVDESEKNTKVKVADGATTGTTTELAMEQKSIQLAYTAGGATIGIAQAEVDNSDYTSGRDEKQTIVSLAVSF